MTTTIYNYGLDELGGGGWTTNVFKALLLKGSGYTPNKDHHFVSAITPASNEITVGGYSRVTIGGKTRTVDTTNDRIVYDCSDLDFGTPASGETVTALVIFRQVTDDTDSILIAHFTLGSLPLTGASFMVLTGTNGAFFTDQGA